MFVRIRTSVDAKEVGYMPNLEIFESFCRELREVNWQAARDGRVLTRNQGESIALKSQDKTLNQTDADAVCEADKPGLFPVR